MEEVHHLYGAQAAVRPGHLPERGGTVTSLLSRADLDTAQSQQFVEESFSGSLPAFITAFTGERSCRRMRSSELQRLIDQNRG